MRSSRSMRFQAVVLAATLLLVVMAFFVPLSAAAGKEAKVESSFDFESVNGWRVISSGSGATTGADIAGTSYTGQRSLHLEADQNDLLVVEKGFAISKEEKLHFKMSFYVNIGAGVPSDLNLLVSPSTKVVDHDDDDTDFKAKTINERAGDWSIGAADANGWRLVTLETNITTNAATVMYVIIGVYDGTSINVDDVEITIDRVGTSGSTSITESFRKFVKSMGIVNITVQQVIMLVVACVLFVLAVRFQFEPLLLLPIGFGIFLANMPIFMGGEVTTLMGEEGFLYFIYKWGISEYGLFPLIIFLGIGAMTDFGPLLANPKTALLGAAAQFGIFLTLLGALALGLVDVNIGPVNLSFDFGLAEAAAIGIIGGADGPTAIYTSSQLAPHLLGPIAVAAYSYMALVPMIQPPIMKLLTSKKERSVKMEQLREVSKIEKVLFPIAVTLACAIVVPSAVPLVGMLMFGNLIRESGVVNRLSETAQGSLINIVTIFLGLCVGATMSGELFLKFSTIGILVLGIVAFSFGTMAGVMMGKLFYILSKGKVNPLIGAAGVSAVPMAARVVNKVGQEEDPTNFLLMHAMGPNVSGVIGSAVAAGVLIALVG